MEIEKTVEFVRDDPVVFKMIEAFKCGMGIKVFISSQIFST